VELSLPGGLLPCAGASLGLELGSRNNHSYSKMIFNIYLLLVTLLLISYLEAHIFFQWNCLNLRRIDELKKKQEFKCEDDVSSGAFSLFRGRHNVRRTHFTKILG